ncbi:Lar family restriction alleviation protein [Pseudomonas lundensis]|uniref:Lar family restriction alleviation protein n=1 Tax=Pseudomonas lundensis TaxID=86185 RepID=UPI000BA26108|nr:Lar family restriction alleviation protein [Pseudomonas lundensis]OZY31076.1 hypothetical protein CJF36_19110 [Pseudomonas lundensis]
MSVATIKLQVVLSACPFCGGPPVPIVIDTEPPYVAAVELADYGHDGVLVDAYVFCHECGSQGPTHEAVLYERGDYHLALAGAVANWQSRDARHAVLYQASAAGGLNLFPRSGK